MSRADVLGIILRMSPCRAEHLSVEAHSADAVIITCTLCTVADPKRRLHK
jgi:ubiquinone/menaquinone biosynthesis C-methylase UbiE